MQGSARSIQSSEAIVQVRDFCFFSATEAFCLKSSHFTFLFNAFFSIFNNLHDDIENVNYFEK